MTTRVIYLQNQQERPGTTHITFPSGEKHIRIENIDYFDKAVLVYSDPTGDVMKLGMAVDICRRAGVKTIDLIMEYVPYARQDRVAYEGDPLSIKVFATFVNSLNLDTVLITDPHSEITPVLLNNSVVIPQHEIAEKAILYLYDCTHSEIAIVAPDLGAAKKAKNLQHSVQSQRGVNHPIIQCDKTRCPKTGDITGFRILDGNPLGFYCLMVDDICDGGGTFLGLSKVLEDAGTRRQSLYVTHGIFSKGIDTLKESFDFIFTSDSFPETPGTLVFKLGEYR